MRTRNQPPPVLDAAPDLRGNVDSLQRGLEILRLFGPDEPSLSVSEIATRIGLPSPTTSRLIETLKASRFVTSLPGTDIVHPSVACHHIGAAQILGDDLRLAAEQPLKSLSNEAGSKVCLGVRERTNMLCILEYRASWDRQSPSLEGGKVPIATSAMGRAWLWAQQPQVQAELIQRIRTEADSDLGKTAMPSVYRAFHDLEVHGYCVDTSDDYLSVATPLQITDVVNASVSCTVRPSLDEAHESELAEKLLKAVRTIVTAFRRVTKDRRSPHTT
ncbi:IclR family transcriptional regulator [Paraburkholderia caribensis]|uniref:IclR family transcriptional regulator n=1 Tax=Paraburkholderia caribensis TaxID=75105 RepID=UPI001CC417FF